MNAPALSADDARAERLHPLALVSGFGKAVRNMIGGVAAGGFVAFQGRPELGLLILGGIILSAVVGLVLHWLRFSFRVGSDAIRIDSGILSRNHRTIPFDRVADVSLAQGPVQRLLGVARVTLETGGAGAGAEEGVLDGIALHRAESLRELVRARRARGQLLPDDASAEAAEEQARPLFAMDLRRVLTLGLFNFSLALFAGLFGASQTLGDVLDINPFERSFWRPILEQSGWGEWLLAHRISMALAGIVVLVVAGVLTGLVRTLLREFGFRLDRTGSGFRRRRGLLTRTDVSLPLRRIQAGLIATGPVRDRFGWRAFKVLSLAGESAEAGKSERGDHVLAPLARDDELEPIAAELGWRLPGAETGWRKVSKAHVTSFLAFLGTLMTVIAVGGLTALTLAEAKSWAFVQPVAIPIGLFLLLSGLRLLEWRHTAFALEEGRLVIRTGWWRRRTLLIPLDKVETVTLTENSLSRRFGIASLVVDVAGGSASGQEIPSLPRQEARALRRLLLGTAA